MEGLLDGIREDLRKKFEKVRELAVRAPGVIKPLITEDDVLHDVLDKNADGVVPEENASTFAALVANRLAGQKNEATAIRNVSEAKTPLRTLERKVDRDDKRLYKAWTKSYLDDTTEGDAARPQIPTATAMPAHTALLTSDADSGLHAATPELPWRLPGDVDFSHTIPVLLTGQTVGPFAPNTLVTFRVRTSNSTPGVALSASKAVLVS